MRIRKPFAASFILLLFLSALAGFTPPSYALPSYKQSDKALHFLAFFLLTLAFYWILEASRRKVLQFTFLVCTLGLGVASEVVQGVLPINRTFDPYDILANVAGSGLALAACNWYHKRMLERKRAARGYAAVAGDDDEDRDIELGGGGSASAGRAGGQELGVVRASVEQELETWDENAEDWETTEPEIGVGASNEAGVGAAAAAGVSAGTEELGEGKKRND